MGWAWSSGFASGKSTSSGTTVTGTAGLAAAVGTVVVAVVATDNTQTTDGNTSEVASITDPRSNTWTKAREFCNGQGFANAGATVAIFYCKVTTQIETSDTITVTLANTHTAKCFSADLFTVSGTISVAGTADLANDGADPGSMTISSLASKEYLFVRGIASESNDASPYTATANYTQFSADQVADTGVSAASMSVHCEWRILTGTGDTSDPTLFSADHASAYVALLATPSNTANLLRGLLGRPFGGKL